MTISYELERLFALWLMNCSSAGFRRLYRERQVSSTGRLVNEVLLTGLYWRYTRRNMNTYLKFGILMALIVGSLVWLAVGGISDTKTYYKTIAELQQMGKSAEGKRLRVGGNVQAGSIVKGATQTAFTLHQGANTLNVVYTGMDPLPDTFRNDAIALADGRLASNGVFEANKIQAKCASKYEAKPAQRGLTHETAKPATISSDMVPLRSAGRG